MPESMREMEGPFLLDSKIIDLKVTLAKPGNYYLGEYRDRTFYVLYVGSDHVNVKIRLKQHIGEPCPYFMFRYASSPKDAYVFESQKYHDFGGERGNLLNKIHPAKPDGSDWKCPVCGK